MKLDTPPKGSIKNSFVFFLLCVNDQIYLHPSHSILHRALDKIAEIKSLLEERRIGKFWMLVCKPVHLRAFEQLWKLIDPFSFCSCQDGRSVQ